MRERKKISMKSYIDRMIFLYIYQRWEGTDSGSSGGFLYLVLLLTVMIQVKGFVLQEVAFEAGPELKEPLGGGGQVGLLYSSDR